MGKQGSIKAGRAYVELFVEDSKLVRGLRQASGKLKKFGASIVGMGAKLAAVGGAIAAPIVLATKTFAKMGDTVAKMAARTGISTEALSELGFAAEQSGADIGTLEKGVRRMQQTIVDAERGTKTATDALGLFGLTLEELKGLSPEDQIKLFADKMEGIEDPTVKAAAAMQVFGRSGAQLIPLLDKGRAGMEALQKQARDLGITISGEDATAAADFTDIMNKLNKAVKAAVFQVGAAMTPVLSKVAKLLTTVGVATGRWIKQNRGVIVAVAGVAATLVGAGIAVATMGASIIALGFGLSAMATIATTAGAALGIVATVVGALLSPIGLMGVAVVAVTASVLAFSGAAGKAADFVSSAFGALKDHALKSFDGIAKALAAGDIELALKIVTLNLKLLWLKMTKAISEAWQGFKDFAISVWDAMIDFLASKLTAFKDIAIGVWNSLASATKPIWQGAMDAHAAAVDWLAERLVGFEDIAIGVFERIAESVKSTWSKMIDFLAGQIADLSVKLAPTIAKVIPSLNTDALDVLGLGGSKSSPKVDQDANRQNLVDQINAALSDPTNVPGSTPPATGKEKPLGESLGKTVDGIANELSELEKALEDANRLKFVNEINAALNKDFVKPKRPPLDPEDPNDPNAGDDSGDSPADRAREAVANFGKSGLSNASRLGISGGSVIGGGGQGLANVSANIATATKSGPGSESGKSAKDTTLEGIKSQLNNAVRFLRQIEDNTEKNGSCVVK